MDDNLQELRRDIEHTRTALREKISLLEDRIDVARKTTLNPAYHVRNHPGAALGMSVALGWILGRWMRPDSSNRVAEPDAGEHRSQIAREWARSAGAVTARRTGALAGVVLSRFLSDRLRKLYGW